ncbi:hypothetical protein J3Q64DRAFT_1700423 [Phycomyces blakesleeanus]|uniref:Uncharacterized protein n=2 Tax=Phycomyces blakesleeanus TaxID=4837 RepID=A0A162U6K9_PHYB8|nr:hypothetical protein PHYBLDRAFT_169016 [Phycomyces blakesleeanus NRRL 1555(-)]OAD72753.1 hypothetical protein PHYBLDRAFT_169016 [Phycomyces blakesleeanus NRRL 1555(-)]|eukprot:XP_018290793.1 hypothetical protein PHYBLDRAFT_169016 [Phycomyces blakesleeanus NRRL 1555(-)]
MIEEKSALSFPDNLSSSKDYRNSLENLILLAVLLSTKQRYYYKEPKVKRVSRFYSANFAFPCTSTNPKSTNALKSDISAEFGRSSVLVMRNRSTPHSRYNEPIKGVEMRRLLCKYEPNVLYATDHLFKKKLTKVTSLCLYHRTQTPHATYNFGFTDLNYLESMSPLRLKGRLWKQDLAKISY